jgi:hypothetical protein
MQDPFSQAVQSIVNEQETIIGPLALEQARKVKGLEIDIATHQVKFDGNKTEILDHLVRQYQAIFGQTSVQVCKDAVQPLLSKLSAQEIPSSLR